MGLGPFDLTGGPFLILYLVLLVAAAVAGFVIPVRLRPPGRKQDIVDPDVLAVLAGGKGRFVEALVARLLARGALVILGRSGFGAKAGASGNTAAEQRVLALTAPIKWTTIQSQIADYAEPVARKLAGSGLHMTDEEAARTRWWQTLPYVLLIGFGTIKLMVGEARGKPVGFLIGLLVVTAVFAAIRWFALDRRTQAAHDALAEAASRNERLKRAPTTSEIGTAVALFGTGVLAGSAWNDFHRMRSASSGDGGSSSSSDGGSGCGGGGSGCGGCGGCGS
jgi:uncharacterized protein (TIGR04222 family)